MEGHTHAHLILFAQIFTPSLEPFFLLLEVSATHDWQNQHNFIYLKQYRIDLPKGQRRRQR